MLDSCFSSFMQRRYLPTRRVFHLNQILTGFRMNEQWSTCLDKSFNWFSCPTSMIYYRNETCFGKSLKYGQHAKLLLQIILMDDCLSFAANMKHRVGRKPETEFIQVSDSFFRINKS